MQVNNIDKLINIKEMFHKISVLNFTNELHSNNRFSFLDIFVKIKHNSINHKVTDYGRCLDINSECPDKYKNVVP